MSLLHGAVRVESLAVLSRFRTDLRDCLTARADALFELTDAMLCTDGPVRSLVDLALAPEHRRGHGALYAGLNRGGLDVARLRRALAGVPLPQAAGGRLVLAADVSPWLRPDAGTVPDRSFRHTYGRGDVKHQMMPGSPYSVVVALETGRTSWSGLLDAVRLAPVRTGPPPRPTGSARSLNASSPQASGPRAIRRSSSCWMPDTMRRASLTCWSACRSRSWAGRGRTG